MQGQAHPRSRGENHPLIAVMATPEGLIPAHAGKTSRASRTHSRTWAHPRSRGENRRFRRSYVMGFGSSPLTRGKRLGDQARRLPPRLIPAHAGKTPVGPTKPPKTAAHPRSRGENITQQSNGYGSLGSSPLTRGKPGRGLGDQARGRLIPAHAGKTCQASSIPSR